MRAICISAAVLVISFLTGCETVFPDGFVGDSWAPVTQSYAGGPVARTQPRYAYRRMDNWRSREITGYQRFGPYTNRYGQPYVVVRRFYSDGSYEDSPQLLRNAYRRY
ncbi:MAG: hypothetical protein SFU53_15270 [Terrimicrobiaceae bacterium]|nr:hypothetical protein [Terrimicrobiaceae bacterium]